MLSHRLNFGAAGASSDLECHRATREAIWALDERIHAIKAAHGYRPGVAADLDRERLKLLDSMMLPRGES